MARIAAANGRSRSLARDCSRSRRSNASPATGREEEAHSAKAGEPWTPREPGRSSGSRKRAMCRARRAPRRGGAAEHLARDGDDEGVKGAPAPGRHGTCHGSGRLQVGGGEQALRPHRFHLPGELSGWVRRLDLVQCGQCPPRTAVREKEHARPREGHASIPARVRGAPGVGQQRLCARQLTSCAIRDSASASPASRPAPAATAARAKRSPVTGSWRELACSAAPTRASMSTSPPASNASPPPDGCRRLVASPSRRARTRASARRAAVRFAPSSL